MRKYLIVFLAIGAALLLAGCAQQEKAPAEKETQLTILTGGAAGTYYRWSNGNGNQ